MPGSLFINLEEVFSARRINKLTEYLEKLKFTTITFIILNTE